MLSKSIRIEDYSANKSSFLLEFDEFYDYDFPREDTVPAGNYHGLIVQAHPGENKYHDPCIDVYFQLLNNIELKKDTAKIKVDAYYRTDYNEKTLEKLPEGRYNTIPITSLTFALEDLAALIDTIP